MSTKSALGSTELGDADGNCKRHFGLKHIVRLQPKEEKRGRKLGSILHVSLRFWYEQFLPGGPPQHWYEKTREERIAEVGRGYPQYIQEGEHIFAKYIETYGDIDRSWRILAVEKQYTITVREILEWAKGTLSRTALVAAEKLDPNQSVSIRPDLIVENYANGVQYEFDYKSTLGLYNRLARWTDYNSYGLDWQAMMYLWITRHIVDAKGNLEFPRMKSFWIQRLLTVHPFSADRNEVSMTDDAYSYIPSQILIRLEKRNRLVAAHARSGFEELDPSYGYACWNRFGACDYFNICRVSDSQKPGIMQEIYRIEDPTEREA